MELYNNFNKKFSFNNENCHLPDVDQFYSGSSAGEKIESLQTIKRILNFVKSKLNDYKIEEWSQHTKYRNPSDLIAQHLKNTIKAEFVTQAFAKFFECVNSYPLVDENLIETFFSVHLCEAPGAFITSLNHYLKLNHPQTEFNWIGTTLNPYYEGNSLGNTILDDRLILHTLPNWFFGDTYDGNILNVDNIKSLVKSCKKLGDVNLVTADGSIDCLDRPEYQEQYVSKLHTAEFITSLSLLANEGSMLIKFFTFFETTTVAMLYILNCCFKSVHLFKPATSKEGNSEVYVIALKFNKTSITDAHIEKMLENFQNDDLAMLPMHVIPQNFLNQVNNAARFFMNLQVEVIENNIRTFRKHDKREYERIKALKSQMVEEYIKLYHMKPIGEHQKLLHGIVLNTEINLNQRVHSGSHAERISFRELSKDDQLTILYAKLQKFCDSIPYQGFMKHDKAINLCPLEEPLEFLKIIRGKPIEKVLSSKFIVMSIFKYFNELRSYTEEQPEFEGTWKESRPINQNFIDIAIEDFKQSSNYDTYEKDVAMKIIHKIIDLKCDITIARLPLFTQFLVGIIFFIGCYVYEEIHFDKSVCQLKLKNLRPKGVENLKILMEIINQHRSSGIIGICDTKKLFVSNTDFYKSIIDYNTHVCMHFCSFYLNCVRS